MSNGRIGLVGLIGCALSLCGAARAADSVSDWEQLRQLRPGDQVKVEIRGKRNVTANFRGFTSDGLQLVQGSTKEIEVARTDVRRVYQVRTRARAAAPWLGAAAGFGVGFAVGWKVGDPPGCSFLCMAPRSATGPAAGAIGAALGALVGHFAAGRTDRLVYFAP